MEEASGVDLVWQGFGAERTRPLFERFPGQYRALVVETNDPLQWHRIRFKCPELHDYNLKPEQCPWADKAPWLGGKNAGSWSHPCIGDIVWIAFEKQHPYGPIWTGFATPTRRKYYPLESIFTKSPLAVKEDGTADEKPSDFQEDYLPKDRRPMSHGNQDRYGNINLTSSVGFYPTEHKEKPAPTGTDAISESKFNIGDKPEVNNPDKKYIANVTKYGVMMVMSDVGYYWKKDGNYGEFEGDFDKDRDFEIKRYFYLQKLLNEDQPKSESQDQRRFEVKTRAGHKIEMRDVGWAQEGGGMSGMTDAGQTKSRPDEYGEPRVLSKWSGSDERWLKLRTKGGHLLQFMDTGFHPEEDKFYKKNLIEEVGAKCDGEEDDEWTKRDARQMRLVTRWGIKIVLDDRGSDPKDATEKEKPRANGWLFKSRRSWTTETSTQRGFAFEANDKDELDTSRWYSPKSKLIELNDKKDYVLFCTDMSGDISREWQRLKENEFALGIGMTYSPEQDTHHLKLDKANGYLRLKTSGNKDNGRKAEPESFPTVEQVENQGLEARDGRVGADGAWTEILDGQRRGMWFSKRYGLGIWRAKAGNDQLIMICDSNEENPSRIVIRNNVKGPIQIYCAADIEIIAGENIALKAGGQISMKAGTSINMEAGGGHAQLTGAAWNMDVPDNAPQHTGFLPQAFPGVGAQSATGGPYTVLDPQPIIQKKIEPADRAKVGNGPFDEVSENIIKG